jgi:hypothetical protein
MKRHLIEASSDYAHEDEDGIRPISIIDAEIIEYVTTIAKRLGNKEFTAILSKWKQEDDGDVLSELQNFNDAFQGKEPVSATIDFITIKTLTMRVGLLVSIQPIDSYDMKRQKPNYRLIINRDEGSKIAFANAEVEFSSADERNQEVARLRERLREFTNIRFL